MSVNMPSNPFPNDSIANAAKSAETFQSSSVSNGDTLEASSTNELNKLMASENPAPKLEGPQTDTSIIGAYKIYAAAMSAYRKYFSASDNANLEASRKFSGLAVEQSNEFAYLIKQKEAAIAKLQEEIKGKLSELQKKIDEMKKLQKDHQKAIDEINSGNGLEKQQYEELIRAYDDYVAKMKSIGAIDLGNGNFLIPDDPNNPENAKNIKEKYNQFTKDYQKAVGKFNDYWKGRSDEINKYNAATTAYNQSVAEYNKAVNAFISENRLSDYFKEKGITIPLLEMADRRDLSGYQDRIHFPSLIHSVPSTIFTYPPPDYARSIGQAGPPALPKLNDFPSFNTQDLYSALYQIGYDSHIAPLDQALIQYPIFWSFAMSRNIHELANKDLSSSETLLNSKPLAHKLIPSSSSSLGLSSNSTSSLAMQALDMSIPHLQKILGQILIKRSDCKHLFKYPRKIKKYRKRERT